MDDSADDLLCPVVLGVIFELFFSLALGVTPASDSPSSFFAVLSFRVRAVFNFAIRKSAKGMVSYATLRYAKKKGGKEPT